MALSMVMTFKIKHQKHNFQGYILVASSSKTLTGSGEVFTQLSQPQSLRTSGTQGRKEAKCLLGVVSREATLLESESAEENQEALGGD